MTEAAALAQCYFDLSNEGRLDEIEALFTDSTTYSSEIAGVLLGRAEIIAMQRAFFAGFRSLKWTIHSSKDISAGVVLLDFTPNGVRADGVPIERTGLEYVVVHEGKLQHIEVRSKG